MKYEAKNFENLLGLEGFSDKALQTHFTLYQGYVNNTNKVLGALAEKTKNSPADSPEFAELQRRLGWEFNGMRLHEYYFSQLSKNAQPADPNSALGKKIIADFGSFETWQNHFKSMATMRGIGWAILYFDATADRLINCWINEHDVGHPAGCTPILVLDVFEHAFMLDYGTKRADYITAFFKALDWPTLEKRFE